MKLKITFISFILFPFILSCLPLKNIRHSKNKEDRLLVKAYDAYILKRYDEACKIYKEYFLLDHRNALYEAFAFYADCLHKTGKTGSGKTIYENAIELVKKNRRNYLENAYIELLRWYKMYPEFPEELTEKGGFELYIAPPKLYHFFPLQYPDSAYIDGLEGEVEVKMLINENGDPIKLKIQYSSSPVFNDAAVYSARKSLYRPGSRCGRPAKFWVVLPIVFRL